MRERLFFVILDYTANLELDNHALDNLHNKVVSLKKIFNLIIRRINLKKFFLPVIFFLIFIPLAYSQNLKCELKGANWECVYERAKCEITQKEIKCEILETPFGSERKKINIFGTEYQPYDKGRIYLQLLDSQTPVNNASCFLDLYYPDKIMWFDDALMTHLNGSEGIYYFDLIIPPFDGVYMLTAKCLYVVDYTKENADNFTIISGNEIEGNYTYTYFKDYQFHKIEEGKFNFLEIIYNFTNVSFPSNYTGMVIYWEGVWDDAKENVEIFLYDFCNSSWSNLPNKINYYSPMISNFILNATCFVENGKLEIRFYSNTDTVKSILYTDLLEIRFYYLTYGQVEMVRGGGEIHVSKGFDELYHKLKKFIVAYFSTEVTNRTCIDDNTLREYRVVDYTIVDEKGNVEQLNVTKHQDINCPFGCRNDECASPPYIVYGILVAIIVGLIIIYFIFR